MDTLAHQRDLLAQQIAAQEDRTTSERNRLVALIHGLEAESSQLESQIAIQEERIRISEDLLQAAAKLNARRNMSESEYRERQESNLQHKQALSVLGQQLAEHRNRLTEHGMRLSNSDGDGGAKPDPAQRSGGGRAAHRRDQWAPRLRPARAECRPGRDVAGHRRPHGRPEAFAARDRSRRQRPGGGTLRPTRAIGFVRPEQEVRIFYDAFPYQSFGTYHGRIVRVSQTILKGTDLSAPVTLSEPAYKVTVALDRPDIDAYGQKIPCKRICSCAQTSSSAAASC